MHSTARRDLAAAALVYLDVSWTGRQTLVAVPGARSLRRCPQLDREREREREGQRKRQTARRVDEPTEPLESRHMLSVNGSTDLVSGKSLSSVNTRSARPAEPRYRQALLGNSLSAISRQSWAPARRPPGSRCRTCR